MGTRFVPYSTRQQARLFYKLMRRPWRADFSLQDSGAVGDWSVPKLHALCADDALGDEIFDRLDRVRKRIDVRPLVKVRVRRWLREEESSGTIVADKICWNLVRKAVGLKPLSSMELKAISFRLPNQMQRRRITRELRRRPQPLPMKEDLVREAAARKTITEVRRRLTAAGYRVLETELIPLWKDLCGGHPFYARDQARKHRDKIIASVRVDRFIDLARINGFLKSEPAIIKYVNLRRPGFLPLLYLLIKPL